MTGWTNSTNFPSTPGAFDTSYNSGDDIFISKFDTNLFANPVKVPYVSPKITVDGNVSEGAWDIATDRKQDSHWDDEQHNNVRCALG